MKTKSTFKKFNNEVIDLYDIIRTLVKEKVTIIIFTTFLTLTGLIYSINLPSKFYSTITVAGFSDSTSSMFHYYDQVTYFEDNNFKTESREDLKNNLSNELFREILYTTNFEIFITNNSVAEPLIDFLKNQDISVEEYIRDRDNIERSENDDNLLSQFVFNFSEGINGDEILNEYVYTISYKVLSSFLINIESIIKQKINKKTKALNIASEMGIFLPDKTSLSKDEYLKGEKLLTLEIKNLKSELDNIQKSITELDNNKDFLNGEILIKNPSFNFRWMPIVYKPFIQQYPRSTIQNIFLSFILGFVLSLIVIFIKINFRKVFKN